MIIADNKYFIAFLFVLFLVPLSIYRIGNNLGSGIQWALFHYQQTIFGNQVFTVINDLEYVFSGFVSGKSAISLLLWSSAAFILIVVLVILIIEFLRGTTTGFKGTALLVVLSGFLFLFSCMAQYGVTFHGPAGFCIPIGIPVVWGVGILMFRSCVSSGEGEECMESVPESEDESEAKGNDE